MLRSLKDSAGGRRAGDFDHGCSSEWLHRGDADPKRGFDSAHARRTANGQRQPRERG